jgi:hypothetical protein
MTINTETFVADVLVTRNALTHAGSTKPNRKPLKGKELFLLTQKMRAMLRGVLLLYLEIPTAQIGDTLSRQATHWR